MARMTSLLLACSLLVDPALTHSLTSHEQKSPRFHSHYCESQALVGALTGFVFYPLKTGKVYVDRLVGTSKRQQDFIFNATGLKAALAMILTYGALKALSFYFPLSDEVARSMSLFVGMPNFAQLLDAERGRGGGSFHRPSPPRRISDTEAFMQRAKDHGYVVTVRDFLVPAVAGSQSLYAVMTRLRNRETEDIEIGSGEVEFWRDLRRHGAHFERIKSIRPLWGGVTLPLLTKVRQELDKNSPDFQAIEWAYTTFGWHTELRQAVDHAFIEPAIPEVQSLMERHDVLMDLIELLEEMGRRTARERHGHRATLRQDRHHIITFLRFSLHNRSVLDFILSHIYAQGSRESAAAYDPNLIHPRYLELFNAFWRFAEEREREYITHQLLLARLQELLDKERSGHGLSAHDLALRRAIVTVFVRHAVALPATSPLENFVLRGDPKHGGHLRAPYPHPEEVLAATRFSFGRSPDISVREADRIHSLGSIARVRHHAQEAMKGVSSRRDLIRAFLLPVALAASGFSGSLVVSQSAEATVAFKPGLGEVTKQHIDFEVFDPQVFQADHVLTQEVLPQLMQWIRRQNDVSSMVRNQGPTVDVRRVFRDLRAELLSSLLRSGARAELDEILKPAQPSMDNPQLPLDAMIYVALPRYLARRGIMMNIGSVRINGPESMISDYETHAMLETVGLYRVEGKQVVALQLWGQEHTFAVLDISEPLRYLDQPLGVPFQGTVGQANFDNILLFRRTIDEYAPAYVKDIAAQRARVAPYANTRWSAEVRINGQMVDPLSFALNMLLRREWADSPQPGQVKDRIVRQTITHEAQHILDDREGRSSANLLPLGTWKEYDETINRWFVVNELMARVTEARHAPPDDKQLALLRWLAELLSVDENRGFRLTAYNLIDLILESIAEEPSRFPEIRLFPGPVFTLRAQIAAQLSQLTPEHIDEILDAIYSKRDLIPGQIKMPSVVNHAELYRGPQYVESSQSVWTRRLRVGMSAFGVIAGGAWLLKWRQERMQSKRDAQIAFVGQATRGRLTPEAVEEILLAQHSRQRLAAVLAKHSLALTGKRSTAGFSQQLVEAAERTSSPGSRWIRFLAWGMLISGLLAGSYFLYSWWSGTLMLGTLMPGSEEVKWSGAFFLSWLLPPLQPLLDAERGRGGGHAGEKGVDYFAYALEVERSWWEFSQALSDTLADAKRDKISIARIAEASGLPLKRLQQLASANGEFPTEKEIKILAKFFHISPTAMFEGHGRVFAKYQNLLKLGLLQTPDQRRILPVSEVVKWLELVQSFGGNIASLAREGHRSEMEVEQALLQHPVLSARLLAPMIDRMRAAEKAYSDWFMRQGQTVQRHAAHSGWKMVNIGYAGVDNLREDEPADYFELWKWRPDDIYSIFNASEGFGFFGVAAEAGKAETGFVVHEHPNTDFERIEGRIARSRQIFKPDQNPMLVALAHPRTEARVREIVRRVAKSPAWRKSPILIIPISDESAQVFATREGLVIGKEKEKKPASIYIPWVLINDMAKKNRKDLFAALASYRKYLLPDTPAADSRPRTSSNRSSRRLSASA